MPEKKTLDGEKLGFSVYRFGFFILICLLMRPFLVSSAVWRWRYRCASADPRRDFRGGGLLALENLCFFRRRYPIQFEAFSRKSYEAGFPMAAAFINVTHMLAAYLRLTTPSGLGGGELQAPRRALRNFLRLCLSAAAAEEETEENFLPETTALRTPGPLPSRSTEVLRPPSCSSLPPGRRLRRRASDSKQHAAPAEVGRVTEKRALTVFGHLFASACIRLDHELALRGAWQHEGTDPPLQSPRHTPMHLTNHRRLQVSLQNSRGLSRALHHLHGASSRESGLAGDRSGGSNCESRQSQASRESVLTPVEAHRGATSSPVRSLLAPEDTVSCPTSGVVSGGTTPRSTGGHSCPCPQQGPPGSTESPRDPQPQRPCGEEPSDTLLHRRAQLCFGEALKEVRIAVDAVLCDGDVETVSDLHAICRGCWA
ncbi:ELMO/CED-12 family domain-containing protein, putative [Eimeria maxima]|uniref:ELMO/CED-12 family domain-containing protein, putative n=1 Tax=Eimeria maxima TaxID=5804 RepID=U6M4V7_EIMMA|nr:ELMO/CED-12 family domain-containing protein, putative [Eimeria maxima]CDJ59036.1 ELMO/CED-12 family domain-containing protein, putative [Eimeria maxima]